MVCPFRSAKFIVSAEPPADEDVATSYTWAVILGGTRCLGVAESGLQNPTQAGTKVFTLTVPKHGDCSTGVNEEYDCLNTLIQSHKATKMYVDSLPKKKKFIELSSLIQKLA